MTVPLLTLPTEKVIRVLLIEDNPADVDLIIEALDHLLRLRDPATPAGAEPDLILLDLNLPGLDGGQVLAQIKADPYLRALPVVVLTTSRREEDIVASYLAGANTCIQKPAEYPRYRELVQLLRDYWQETALRPPHDRPRP